MQIFERDCTLHKLLRSSRVYQGLERTYTLTCMEVVLRVRSKQETNT